MPRAVVFDMDGLLFDTEAIVRDAIRSTSARLGFDMPQPLLLSLIGLSSDEGRKLLLQHYGSAFDCDGFWREVDSDFQPSDEIRACCVDVVLDLHDVRHLLARISASMFHRSRERG